MHTYHWKAWACCMLKISLPPPKAWWVDFEHWVESVCCTLAVTLCSALLDTLWSIASFIGCAWSMAMLQQSRVVTVAFLCILGSYLCPEHQGMGTFATAENKREWYIYIYILYIDREWESIPSLQSESYWSTQCQGRQNSWLATSVYSSTTASSWATAIPSQTCVSKLDAPKKPSTPMTSIDICGCFHSDFVNLWDDQLGDPGCHDW